MATFADEPALHEALRRLRADGFRIYDVYSPHPLHGVDEALGIGRSRLPLVALVGGMCGLLLAVALQVYTTAFDWVLDVGGKPPGAPLPFVPIAFELTVLVAGLAATAAFLLGCRLYPGAPAVLFDEGVTEDAYALVLRRREATFDAGRAQRLLEASGARLVRQRTLAP